MAGSFSASQNFYRAILSVFTVSLCVSLVSARLFPSMKVERTWSGSVMVDPRSVSQWQSGYRRGIRSAHEVEANVHEFEYHQGPFKFKYVMLPRGPVPPSGPSPCHNDSPDSALPSDYFPCRASTLP
jgi:hypothetical protein